MRVLVNALSATAPSGQHVLYGHVRQLARWTENEHEFHILSCPRTRPTTTDFGPNVFWHAAPQSTQSWLGRTLWETKSLPGWMTSQRMDLYFTPTGTILPRSPVPQVSLAQNPWCLTAAVPKTFRERCKALAQRSAYRSAQRSADFMAYNSNHMRHLYHTNAGGHAARQDAVVYQGLHESTHAIAETTRDPLAKDRHTILCVSVMARWKNCETLLRALRQLHKDQVPARLRLIGGWPDAAYRRQIETEIDQLQLEPHVSIEGHVPREELYAAYRSARVYALLSKCESFGIPALEAQAFGTPVVGSNSCAMPEIGGEGGVYLNPEDVASVTATLHRMLTDDVEWSRRSVLAIQNSKRFRWESCSAPLLKIFSLSSPPAVSVMAGTAHASAAPCERPVELGSDGTCRARSA